MFDVFYTGLKPGFFAFEQPAASIADAAGQSRTKFFWYIYGVADCTKFKFDFVPVPWEEDHIHVFPSQWQRDGGICLVNKYTAGDQKWHWRNEQQVIRLPDQTNWFVPDYIDTASVDFSWHPDPHDPPYVYHFPSQWQSASGVTYTVPGATEIKLVSPFVVKATTDNVNWVVPEDIDPASIDFSWHPNVLDPAYIYHFPSEWQQSSGLTYTVPGATEIKLMDEAPVVGQTMTKVLDIFFIDYSNQQSSVRYDRLKAKYPEIQRVRYVNTIMDTIRRCVNRTKTNKFWIISSLNVYDDFDFSWQPESWQQYMTHVFGSQWNKWSDTFLISKWEFERNAKWANGIEEFPNLNFVQDQQVRASDDANNIYYVEWGNPESASQLERLKEKYPNIKVTRFVDNYLDTFKRIMSTATTEHVWIINSIADYSKFDFSWQPEAWQAEMIHVFPTRFERRGDTFYINVEMFKQQMVDLELLDWFNVINYCDEQQVHRWPVPHHYYTGDDLVTEVKNYHFEHPYVVFSTFDDITVHPDMCLWSKKDRIAERFTGSGCVSVIPRDVKSDLRTQIYDYPHVNVQNLGLLGDNPQEIIFISYDEPDADANWEIVRSKHPRAKRLHGVQGMERALEAAAEMSETPWYFAVFAKTALHEDFDFSFQPDYWQAPKHYIFHAKNRVNGLSYGHMGVVMYNCNLILNNRNNAFGLDYTLSFPHEVVPIVSAYGNFDTSPYHTWRTTFREVSKLYDMQEKTPSIDTAYRLKVWESKAEGPYAEWALNGARDGREFYLAHKDDYDARKNTFNWEWLRKYFVNKYGDVN